MAMMKQPAVAGQTTVTASHPHPLSKRARRRARRKAAEGAARYPMSQVAARSDGAILVSTADLTDRDLTGREVERYVTLTEAEASVLRGRLTNALGEAASCFAVTLPKRRQP